MLIPADSLVPEGIRLFVLDQFAKSWQTSRKSQGTVEGESAVARESHPDIEKRFAELDEQVQRWITGLVLNGRISVLYHLSKAEKDELIAVATGSQLSDLLREKVAKGFHDGWWTWRRMNGQDGHEGDKAWEEETDAQRENDLVLVDGIATLFAEYASGNDAQKALFNFLYDN